MADKPLEVESETQDTITFKFAPVQGAEGYRFYADGEAVSRTFDPARTTIRFSKGAGSYRVVPLDVAELPDGYSYPPPVTPPPPPPDARKVAEAVYEGYSDVGDVPLWRQYGEQVKADDRLTIVNDPLGQRGKVMRVHVRPGDNNVAGSGSGERAEVMCGSSVTPDGEGEIVATKTAIMLPNEFTSNGSGWNVPLQWHDSEYGGQSPVQYSIINGRDLMVRVWGGTFSNGSGSWRQDYLVASLERNRWYDLAIAEVVSSDSTKGKLRIAVNGQVKIDKTVANLYRGSGRYAKQGWYRAAQPSPTTLYDDSISFWTAPTFEAAFAAVLAA